MTTNLVDYIINSDEVLHFELVALSVYEDILKKIAENDDKGVFRSNRKLLYAELEKQFDSSNDDFVRLVIAYSLISGTYFMINGLNTTGKLDRYSGNRYTEFTSTAIDNAMDITQKLLKKEIQYRVATDLIEIALELSTKQKKKDIINEVNEFVNRISLSDDAILSVKKTVFLVTAINLLIENKKFRTLNLEEKINEVLDFAIEQGDTAQSERSKYNKLGFDCIFPPVFELKIRYYQKLDNKDKIKINEVVKAFAETYENLGKSRKEMGDVHLQVAVNHYEKAVEIYSQHGFTDNLKVAKQLLDETKQELQHWDNPHSIVRKQNLRDYLPVYYPKQLKEFLNEFEQLDINEQIQILISNEQIVPIINKADISKVRAGNKKVNKFSEIFPISMANEKEHTIFHSDREESKESYALYKHIQMSGSVLWMHLLINIFEKKNYIDFSEIFDSDEHLSKHSNLFSKAYELFFYGDIYSALHILVPQVEWWFRDIAYQAGEQISNLNHFPIEQAKTLTPIFNTNTLKEYLGEDCHWLFEQLLTKEPMNIRNKIAHGLELNDNGFCAYFALCILKLVVNKTLESKKTGEENEKI